MTAHGPVAGEGLGATVAAGEAVAEGPVSHAAIARTAASTHAKRIKGVNGVRAGAVTATYPQSGI
jgi:hypothetical protein